MTSHARVHVIQHIRNLDLADGERIVELVGLMLDELGDQLDPQIVLSSVVEKGDEVAIVAANFARYQTTFSDGYTEDRDKLIADIEHGNALVKLRRELRQLFAVKPWRAGEKLTVAQTAVLHTEVSPAHIRRWVERDLVRHERVGDQTLIDPTSFIMTFANEDALESLLESHAALTIDEQVQRAQMLHAYLTAPR